MVIYISFLLVILLLMIYAQFKGMKALSTKNYYLDSEQGGNDSLNKSSFLYYISVLIVFFLSAVRYGVGWDYWAYFETISYGRSTNIINNGETLTILIIELAKFFKQPQLYFIVNSIICVFLIANTSKRYSIDMWLSFIFFVTFPLFFLNSLSVVRNFTAIALTFYGVKYLVDKKILKYFLIVIIASLFHKSALLALIFYFIRNLNLKTYKIIIVVLFIPIIGKLSNLFVSKFFSSYSVYLQETSIQEGTKAIFVFLLIAIASVLFKRKLFLLNDRNRIYFNNFFVGISIYLMFFEYGTMGHRLSLYGTIYSILLLPEIIHLFNKRDRILIKSLVYLFCTIMFLYTVKIGSETYIPYDVFFNK
ncbi:Transmembrane protein EpsG [compost metagenome]